MLTNSDIHLAMIMIDQKDIGVNENTENIQINISKSLNVEGGKIVIERVLHLLNLRSKVELSGLIGVSTGSIATWQTRSTVPYELLIRIHLATGVSMQYLLFDDIVGDINVMQFCADPSVTPSYASINQNLKFFRYPLGKPPHYNGGSQIIKRLIQILKLNSRPELSSTTSVSIGTLSTWQTRKITPFELLCRVHLLTGVSMHYLCFGYEWEERNNHVKETECVENEPLLQQRPSEDIKACNQTYVIDNGILTSKSKYVANDFFWSNAGISPASDSVVMSDNKSFFIDKTATTVTKGLYLFSVNDVFQVGELRQLPDGKTYFYDDGDKYPINEDTTKIHGKVVSILQSI